MRKILHVMIMAASLAGCVVEEFSDTPKRTRVANHYYAPVEHAIRGGVQLMDIADKIDTWLKAATTSERDMIEDRYFRYYKLRAAGDTVRLKDVGGSDFMCGVTRGVGLDTENARWTLITLDDTLHIKRVAPRKWHLANVSADAPLDRYDLTFEKTAFEHQYKISGQGSCYLVVPSPEKVDYTKADYTIDHDVIMQFRQGEDFVSDGSKIQFVKGEISFRSQALSDKATVVLEKENHYSITYKGFTERWPTYFRLIKLYTSRGE